MGPGSPVWQLVGEGKVMVLAINIIYKYRHSEPPCGFGMNHFSSVEDFV